MNATISAAVSAASDNFRTLTGMAGQVTGVWQDSETVAVSVVPSDPIARQDYAGISLILVSKLTGELSRISSAVPPDEILDRMATVKINPTR
jgi:hypothetical protein